MYDVLAFGRMMQDKPRIDAYLGALRKVITPDSFVLELGTGTGVVAFAARAAGARRIVALEPLDAIDTAREIAADNGVQGIEFLQKASEELKLDERADILISDIRGKLPLLGRNVLSLIDARDRLLKPGGTMIAKGDRIYACPIQDPKNFQHHVGLWADNPLNMDMSAAATITANSWYGWESRKAELLAKPLSFIDIDWATITSPHFKETIEFEIQTAGTCHGFGVWFETDVDDEITISTAPDQETMAYGRAYFPVDKAIEVEAGTKLEVRFSARLVNNRYIWRWIVSRDGEKQCDLSNFYGQALSTDTLNKLDTSHTTKLNEKGRLMQAVLGGIAQGDSASTIGKGIRAQFPERFPNVESAIAHATEFHLSYGE